LIRTSKDIFFVPKIILPFAIELIFFPQSLKYHMHVRSTLRLCYAKRRAFLHTRPFTRDPNNGSDTYVCGPRRLLIPSRTLFPCTPQLVKAIHKSRGKFFVLAQTVRVKDQPSSWVNYSRQNFHRDKPESLTLNGTHMESFFARKEVSQPRDILPISKAFFVSVLAR